MIKHHRQSFYESADEVLRHESVRLRMLFGQKLERVWLATGADSSWFNDEPAILDFGEGRQLEVAVYQTGLLAITWNTLDVAQPANWLGCWGGHDLKWQETTSDDWLWAMGRTVSGVQIVDYNCSLGNGVFGIQFGFASGRHLLVYNALDELGVRDAGIQSLNYAVFPVPD